MKRVDPFRFGAVLMLTLLALAILLPRRGWTAQAPLNCSIRIVNQTRSGERKQILFRTRLQSKEQCKSLARIHMPNFEPTKFASKKVAYRWKDVR